MRRARRMLVIPRKKENARRDIADLLEGMPVERIETELIGNEVIVWVSTSQEKKAKEVLKKKDIKCFTSEVVTVKLENKPGELAKIARILTAKGITVKDAHLILKSKKQALYGITTNRPREAAKVVKQLELFLKEKGQQPQQPSAP